MKKLTFSFFTLLLLSLIAFGVSAQEMDKKTKRKKARTLLKESNKLIEQENLDGALVKLDSLLMLDEANPDGFYNKGWIFVLKKDTSLAITTLEEGSKKAPLSTRIKILLARLKIDTGNIESAAADLDFILGIKPNYGEALYLRGLINLYNEETNLAVERFKKALDVYYSKGKKK